MRGSAVGRGTKLVGQAGDLATNFTHDPLGLPRRDLAYLDATLGQHDSLADYVAQTQGCNAVGWDREYVAHRRELCVSAVNAAGISWGADTIRELEAAEGALDVDIAASVSTLADRWRR